MAFLVDQDTNKVGILQIYSLVQPLSVVTRDGTFGGVPMTAEIRMDLPLERTASPSKEGKIASSLQDSVHQTIWAPRALGRRRSSARPS